MLRSRLLATVALLLVVGYALPAFCMPTPAITAQAAPPMPCGGCHGHHQHVPVPAHNCCAAHHAPAALQTLTSIAPLNVVAHRQSAELQSDTHSVMTVSTGHAEFSPPPPAVLRN